MLTLLLLRVLENQWHIMNMLKIHLGGAGDNYPDDRVEMAMKKSLARIDAIKAKAGYQFNPTDDDGGKEALKG